MKGKLFRWITERRIRLLAVDFDRLLPQGGGLFLLGNIGGEKRDEMYVRTRGGIGVFTDADTVEEAVQGCLQDVDAQERLDSGAAETEEQIAFLTVNAFHDAGGALEVVLVYQNADALVFQNRAKRKTRRVLVDHRGQYAFAFQVAFQDVRPVDVRAVKQGLHHRWPGGV